MPYKQTCGETLLAACESNCARALQGDLSDAAKAEIARRERERLKLQERLKREKIGRMRLEANQGAGAGEVLRFRFRFWV